MTTNGRGPAGGPTNQVVIDAGTLCLQRSSLPGALDASLGGLLPLACPMTVQVGASKRKVGFNFDGTPSEDMQYADMPLKAQEIESDATFKFSDEALNGNMILLMKSLSIGSMQKVALEMQKRFAGGVGGTYESDTLNLEVMGNAAFQAYHQNFMADLLLGLKAANFNPACMPARTMGLLNFSSFWDKVSGLGITVHQVWAVEAWMKYYAYQGSGGVMTFDLEYIFYDHFGLDWEDVLKNKDRRLPQYHTGDFFKCWYILQHYRQARPFVTKMRVQLLQLNARS